MRCRPSKKRSSLKKSYLPWGSSVARQATLAGSGVDTVDVGYYKGSDSVGHSYMTGVPVLEDAAKAFAGIPPTSDQRRLKQVTREGGIYYELLTPP